MATDGRYSRRPRSTGRTEDATDAPRRAHFTAGERVRDVVIGMSDGLTVPFALAAGLSGAVGSTGIIVTAGLAEIAAGSIAMGLGGYLAARSDAEHYASERVREETEVREKPAIEADEVDGGLPGLRPHRGGERAGRGGPAQAARGLGRLHDALRARPREAGPAAGPQERAHDRGAPTSPAASSRWRPTSSWRPRRRRSSSRWSSPSSPWRSSATSRALHRRAPVRSALQTALIGGLAAAAAFGIARAIS